MILGPRLAPIAARTSCTFSFERIVTVSTPLRKRPTVSRNVDFPAPLSPRRSINEPFPEDSPTPEELMSSNRASIISSRSSIGITMPFRTPSPTERRLSNLSGTEIGTTGAFVMSYILPYNVENGDLSAHKAQSGRLPVPFNRKDAYTTNTEGPSAGSIARGAGRGPDARL
ncbi:hypothetical protein PLANTIT3_20116 [Plantibacter sp. T3]|nr:hypothetical protein PLANTIT3_20116 [Plantibacter sp. T3]